MLQSDRVFPLRCVGRSVDLGFSRSVKACRAWVQRPKRTATAPFFLGGRLAVLGFDWRRGRSLDADEAESIVARALRKLRCSLSRYPNQNTPRFYDEDSSSNAIKESKHRALRDSHTYYSAEFALAMCEAQAPEFDEIKIFLDPDSATECHITRWLSYLTSQMLARVVCD